MPYILDGLIYIMVSSLLRSLNLNQKGFLVCMEWEQREEIFLRDISRDSQPGTFHYDQTAHLSSSLFQHCLVHLWEVCFSELNVFLLARLLFKSWNRHSWWTKIIHNSNPILSCLPPSREVKHLLPKPPWNRDSFLAVLITSRLAEDCWAHLGKVLYSW